MEKGEGKGLELSFQLSIFKERYTLKPEII